MSKKGGQSKAKALPLRASTIEERVKGESKSSEILRSGEFLENPGNTNFRAPFSAAAKVSLPGNQETGVGHDFIFSIPYLHDSSLHE